MGILYDIYESQGGKLKRCTMCGCIMLAEHDGDICECCLDELYESDPGEDEVDE
jgi:hypothetical protein